VDQIAACGTQLTPPGQGNGKKCEEQLRAKSTHTDNSMWHTLDTSRPGEWSEHEKGKTQQIVGLVFTIFIGPKGQDRIIRLVLPESYFVNTPCL
jgi:hypothetical protein